MVNRIIRIGMESLESCAELYVKVFNSPPWNDGWRLEDARERLSDIFGHPRFVGIGLVDGHEQLMGFLIGHSEKWLESRHFYIHEMCIDNELQGRGLGTRLLSFLEHFCGDNGINRMYLLTARDGQAESFYTRNGFYTSPKMVMMAKRL